MKRCPQCNRVETDDALAFCRVDGTALVSDSSSIGSEAGAAGPGSASIASEIETSILPHKTDANIDRDTARTTVLPAQPAAGATLRLTKPSRRKVVFAVATFVTVAIAIVIVGYFYYSRKTTTAAIDSIAVLPFVNASGDPNTEYLSDGITESIINSLSQLPNLGVIARSSVFNYKGKNSDAPTVGRELKVRSVLMGRVVQRGDNLSISVELVDTTNNHQLWGQQYNRKVADVFAVQEEIAKEISEKLRLKLSSTEQMQLARRPTENLKAFQYYMQGRAYILRRTREDLVNAIQYNEKALQEDPNYALAYAGLADSYAAFGVRGYMTPKDAQ